LLDPEGCLYLSIGVNSVGPTKACYADINAWAQDTYSREALSF